MLVQIETLSYRCLCYVPAHLRKIQAQLAISNNLGQMYLDRLAILHEMPLRDLEQVVCGKYVLKLLQERFPLRLSGQQVWNDVLSAYIFNCPDSPADQMALIELILQDAHSRAC